MKPRCGDCPQNNCRPDCFSRALRRAYRNYNQLELPFMSEGKKNFLDKFFDMADEALSPMEKVLKNDDEPIDADFVDQPAPEEQHEEHDQTGKRWEKVWEEPKWASVLKDGNRAWHVFKIEGQLKAGCAEVFAADQVQMDPVPLSHGITIPACASCIISVSK